MERTRVILGRCREYNITISRKKLELGSKINFAGHIISADGIQPDEEKYAAISRFPRPKSPKDLRSFMGLAQQLASFVPDLAHMTSTLFICSGLFLSYCSDTNLNESFAATCHLIKICFYFSIGKVDMLYCLKI